jgi:hypothetical protein
VARVFDRMAAAARDEAGLFLSIASGFARTPRSSSGRPVR